jgi:hypothetical protein
MCFDGQIIFISNYPIPLGEERFKRRITHTYVDHVMYSCTGCIPPYIPDNQLGLFDINGDQIMQQLETANNSQFTLDISDENAHDAEPRLSRYISTGLNNIMTDEEIEQLFEAM